MSNKWLKVFFFTVCFAIGIRLLLPILLKQFINNILETKLDSYHGEVQDVSISLLRGQYDLKGLKIIKRDSQQKPLLFIEKARIGIHWPPVLLGKIVAKILINNATLRVFDSNNKAQQQYIVEEKPQNWKIALDQIVPIKINFVILKKSTIQFQNKDIEVANVFEIKEIEGVAKNLVTSHSMDRVLSPIFLKGKIADTGKIEVKGGVKITQDPILFDLDFLLKDFQISKLNKLSRYYVPIDFNSGKLTIVSEGVGSEDKLRGYMKVFFDDLDIISAKEDFRSTEHFFIELLAGFGNWLLEVVTAGQVATELSYEAKRGEFNFDWKEGVWNSIKNVGSDIDRSFKGIDLEDQ